MLEDIVSESVYHERIFYLTFEMTIPAEGETSVLVEQFKEASYDYYCGIHENTGINGYDMVTELGSDLEFSGQQAAVSSYEYIEIVRQNFGFDLEAGVTEVTLDPAEEHYWLEVKEVE